MYPKTIMSVTRFHSLNRYYLFAFDGWPQISSCVPVSSFSLWPQESQPWWDHVTYVFPATSLTGQRLFSPSFTLLSLDITAAILTDDNFKYIFLNRKDRIAVRISLKFVPRSLIDNKLALFQVMAWRRTGDKPLPEPMLTQSTDTYMRH